MDYSAEVLARFRDPPQAGAPAPGARDWYRGEAGDLERGTWIVMHARIVAGRVRELRFEAFGCPHVVAACSLAAEQLARQPAARLAAFEHAAVAEPLAVPAEKAGRLLILEDALRNCFQAWENKAVSPATSRTDRHGSDAH